MIIHSNPIIRESGTITESSPVKTSSNLAVSDEVETVTIRQAAKLLGLGNNRLKVYNLIKKGILVNLKTRQWQNAITMDSINAYIRQQNEKDMQETMKQKTILNDLEMESVKV